MKTYLEYLAEAEEAADRRNDGEKGQAYSTTPKLDSHYADSLGRVDIFHHPAQADKVHALYRVMLATAESDGTGNQNLTTDANSFSDVSNFATPFTDIESKMLDKAYKHLGIPATKNATGSTKSKEASDTHTKSPHRVVGDIKLNRK
jgi:hypothetical protein